jgi:O-antigen/teichoic acid export membrane protein
LFLVSQAAILIFLFIYRYFKTEDAFIIVASVLVVMPLLLNVSLNIWLFRGRFKAIAPARSCYEKKYLKDLMGLGLMFFVIQIAALVMYATDNIIITQLYGPAEVVTYSLVYKYYSILYIVFGIISTPLWTMYVDAYKKREIKWIKGSVNNLVRLFYLFTFASAVMVLVSGVFFRLWIGPSFNPPLEINILVGIYVLLMIWGNIWVLPLNAAGRIKLQMIASIIVACLNVPAIYFFNIFFQSITAVVLGNILCILLSCGSMYYYYKITFDRQIDGQPA